MPALRTLLSVVAVLWFGLSFPTAAQDVDGIVRTDWFTAQALTVESDGAGGKWVSVAFVASALARGKAVSIRLTEGDCRLPASLSDRRGNELISAHCAGRGDAARDDDFRLPEPGKTLVHRYHFAGAAGRDIRGPYDVFIPVICSVAGAKSAPPEEVVTSLSFFSLP